jgi:eukaryotic-like serine/threonine-protein kinase
VTIEQSFEDTRLVDGTVIDDCFVVTRYIGKGAKARVYEAEDHCSGLSVAVKVARNAGTRSVEREVACIRAVNSALVGIVYATGHLPDERPYVARDLIDGQPLDTALEPLRGNARSTIQLGLRIAAILDRLHACGFLHCDVKPRNVLAPVTDGIPEISAARLIDFDISRPMMSVLSTGKRCLKAGMPHGTYAYMAPEALQGRALTQAIDIYGLGASLYETFVGEAPFADQRIDLAADRSFKVYAGPFVIKRLTEEFTIQEAEGLPAELRALIERMLRINPDERPDLRTEVLPTLAAVLDGLMVH